MMCTSSFTESSTEEQESTLAEDTTIETFFGVTDIDTDESIGGIKIESGKITIFGGKK